MSSFPKKLRCFGLYHWYLPRLSAPFSISDTEQSGSLGSIKGNNAFLKLELSIIMQKDGKGGGYIMYRKHVLQIRVEADRVPNETVEGERMGGID